MKRDALGLDPAEVEHGDDGRAAATRGLRKLAALLTVAALLFGLVHFTPLGERLRDLPAMGALMHSGGVEAAIWFFGITVLLMMVGMPRLIFYALAGFVFGFEVGLLLALAASMLASFAVFRAARWGGRDWLVQRFGARPLFARIVAVQPTVLSVALVRCLPVSNIILNVALALSTVGTRAFLLGTLIGFLPQGLIAALIGSGVSEYTPLQGAVQLAAAGVIALLFLCFSLRRNRANRS